MRRAAELHWPALLVAATCIGIAAANWVTPPSPVVPAALALGGLAGIAVTDGTRRALALAVALVALGLVWGSIRLEAMDESRLAAEIGRTARAELVVTGSVRRTSWSVRAPAELRRFGELRVRERVLLTLPVGRSPPRGAVLDAVVRLVEPRPADGGFDERAWLARQGIHVVARASSWRQLGSRGGVLGFGDRLGERVQDAVASGTDGVRRALVVGVVLGEDQGLPADVRDDFRASGLAHLLAVSGQNVAYIAGGIFGLGWLLRLSRGVREVLVLVAIAAYVLAVGWQPSVVRAGVAGALVSLAWLVARPRDRWHFLAVGALVLLAWTPTSLLEPGFQLSFTAVAAIFVGLPRLQTWAAGYAVPRGIAETVGIAVVCGLATAPIALYHFDSAPVYTVPANALAAPAVPLVLGFGLAAGVADPVVPAAAVALAWLAGWAAAWIQVVAQITASLPGAQLAPQAALAIVVAAAALGLVIRHARSRGAVRSHVALLLACGVAGAVAVGGWSLRGPDAWEQPSGLRVTFLDVGQGDAALIETPSARVLVDQGPPEADVAGQLAKMGVRSLSAVVLTHPERDHVGGAADVLRELRVGVVLDPFLATTGPDREEAIALARERRVPVREIRAGAEFKAGGLLLRVLWPRDDGFPGEDPNLNAVVIVASYGEIDVLLSADAESEVTADLPLGAVEVLKVAHHGSADPGLAEELRTLRPRIAVVSVGRANDYGHPRAETLAALATVPEIAVYRTDRDGRVVVEADGGRLRVRATRQGGR